MAFRLSVYIAALILFLVLLLILGILIQAWIETKNAPREEMVVCAAHGPIRCSLLLKLPGFNENDPYSGYCPICFHEKMKKAEQGLL